MNLHVPLLHTWNPVDALHRAYRRFRDHLRVEFFLALTDFHHEWWNSPADAIVDFEDYERFTQVNCVQASLLLSLRPE